MELREMITRRRSFRSYTGVPVAGETLEKITAFCAELKPLYPDRPIRSEIIGADCIRSILPWLPPQAVAIFTPEEVDDLENAGFVYQQLDLYLQSLGLGTCWIGMGALNGKGEALTDRKDGMKLAILIAFGYPKGDGLRTGPEAFQRKSLSEIADREDARLEPARLAPSSVNSQPWYFTHGEDCIRAYCIAPGLLRHKSLKRFNRIDMGIALAHLYVSNPGTFRFFREENAPEEKGYYYVGSFTL